MKILEEALHPPYLGFHHLQPVQLLSKVTPPTNTFPENNTSCSSTIIKQQTKLTPTSSISLVTIQQCHSQSGKSSDTSCSTTSVQEQPVTVAKPLAPSNSQPGVQKESKLAAKMKATDASQHKKSKVQDKLERKPAENKSITCPHCGKAYSFRSGLSKHLRKEHSNESQGEPKSYIVCHICRLR